MDDQESDLVKVHLYTTIYWNSKMHDNILHNEWIIFTDKPKYSNIIICFNIRSAFWANVKWGIPREFGNTWSIWHWPSLSDVHQHFLGNKMLTFLGLKNYEQCHNFTNYSLSPSVIYILEQYGTILTILSHWVSESVDAGRWCRSALCWYELKHGRFCSSHYSHPHHQECNWRLQHMDLRMIRWRWTH